MEVTINLNGKEVTGVFYENGKFASSREFLKRQLKQELSAEERVKSDYEYLGQLPHLPECFIKACNEFEASYQRGGITSDEFEAYIKLHPDYEEELVYFTKKITLHRRSYEERTRFREMKQNK